MILHLFHGHRPHLLRDESRQPFIQRHPQIAHATRPQPQRRRQNQIGTVGLQQVCRADVRMECPGDQRHHIHQRFRRFAALRRQVIDFVKRKHSGRRRRAAHCFRALRHQSLFAYRVAHWAFNAIAAEHTSSGAASLSFGGKECVSKEMIAGASEIGDYITCA